MDYYAYGKMIGQSHKEYKPEEMIAELTNEFNIQVSLLDKARAVSGYDECFETMNQTDAMTMWINVDRVYIPKFKEMLTIQLNSDGIKLFDDESDEVAFFAWSSLQTLKYNKESNSWSSEIVNKTYMMDSFILLTDSDKLKYNRVFAFNIDWDLDDEDKEVVLPDSHLFFFNLNDCSSEDYDKDDGFDDQFIGDQLTAKYGFCHKGFGFIEV